MYVNLKNKHLLSIWTYTEFGMFCIFNYSLNTASIDTNKANSTFYKGYYVVDPEKKFKPKLFQQALQFDPGDVYNRTDHNLL
jgi:hypothetical protein